MDGTEPLYKREIGNTLVWRTDPVKGRQTSS